MGGFWRLHTYQLALEEKQTTDLANQGNRIAQSSLHVMCPSCGHYIQHHDKNRGDGRQRECLVVRFGKETKGSDVPKKRFVATDGDNDDDKVVGMGAHMPSFIAMSFEERMAS